MKTNLEKAEAFLSVLTIESEKNMLWTDEDTSYKGHRSAYLIDIGLSVIENICDMDQKTIKSFLESNAMLWWSKVAADWGQAFIARKVVKECIKYTSPGSCELLIEALRQSGVVKFLDTSEYVVNDALCSLVGVNKDDAGHGEAMIWLNMYHGRCQEEWLSRAKMIGVKMQKTVWIRSAGSSFVELFISHKCSLPVFESLIRSGSGFKENQAVFQDIIVQAIKFHRMDCLNFLLKELDDLKPLSSDEILDTGDLSQKDIEKYLIKKYLPFMLIGNEFKDKVSDETTSILVDWLLENVNKKTATQDLNLLHSLDGKEYLATQKRWKIFIDAFERFALKSEHADVKVGAKMVL